jgi:hypothetical protein
MLGQGQDKTRIHTRKKGGPPPHGGPQEKGKVKKQREKGKGRTREKQRLLGCGLFADECPDGVGHERGIFVGSVHLR